MTRASCFAEICYNLVGHGMFARLAFRGRTQGEYHKNYKIKIQIKSTKLYGLEMSP
jgi:hypothetical protein